MESGCDNVFFLFPSPPSLAGVNSFMVYMAYKDLYQVSNTEVRIHCCVAWGIWMGFLLLLMTLTPSAWSVWALWETAGPECFSRSTLRFKSGNGQDAAGKADRELEVPLAAAFSRGQEERPASTSTYQGNASSLRARNSQVLSLAA